MVESAGKERVRRMSTAREEMLSCIRSAISQLGISAREDYLRIQAEYIQTGLLNDQDRVSLFVERLNDYDALVHFSSAADLAKVIGFVLKNRGKQRLVIPADLPAEWLPEGYDFLRDHNLEFGELDRSDGVITACSVAIALTGTIILQDAPQQGRRALSLIPDYHLCIVRKDQLVETVSEAIRLLQKTCSLATTTISGPSATADIEMTRIKGVHGPRDLEIIVLS